MVKVAWNKGKKWPESTKRKISESRKGIAAWNKGKSWSTEVKEKISNSKKGKVSWNKGTHWPESTKRKISRSKLATTLDIKPFYERNRPSSRLRFLVINRDNSKCTHCGKTANETILEVDHIIPVSRGGKNTLDNLTTLCITCNRGKSNLEI
jgi:5-methylcytosine-specific restriction protein A